TTSVWHWHCGPSLNQMFGFWCVFFLALLVSPAHPQTFDEVFPDTFTPVRWAAVKWGNIVTVGLESSGPKTRVYLNNGGTSFTELPTSLPGVWLGFIALGDYNKDGFDDILFCGKAPNGAATELWTNKGGTSFIKMSYFLPC